MTDLTVGAIEQLPRIAKLFLAAQKIAWQTPNFFQKKGPGPGNHANLQFMSSLRQVANGLFGCDLSEKPVCGAADYRLDFYLPEERTAVEFAFGLCYPLSEYERDIFKCLLAQEDGLPIERLVLIGKPGALARQGADGPVMIANFVARTHGLKVEVMELLEDVISELSAPRSIAQL